MRRSEEEMMSLILDFAREDDRVRAVWMNGSRANPSAPRDCWQDFDIVYAVTDMASFLASDGWVDRFGTRVIMQTRRDQVEFDDETDFSDWFIYLMQFTDGNRIDLSLVPLERAEAAFLEDRMCVPLLDKDGRLPAIPPSTDEDYWVKPPTARQFHNCCNEFRWVSTYVAKGIWREELPYAHEMLDHYTREALIQMLEWEAGVRTDFLLSTGKCGKYLERFLPAEEWKLYRETYCGSGYGEIWDALFAMHQLFARSSRFVAAAFGFPIDVDEERRVLAYLSEGVSGQNPSDLPR